MAYLKHKTSGAITQALDESSRVYEQLAAMRLVDGVTTVWEDVSETAISDTTKRALVFYEPGAAAAADVTVGNAEGELPPRGATGMTASYVPNSTVTGANTDSRTLTVTQTTIAGTSSPTRAVTTLATLAFTAGVNATAGLEKAFTINQATFVADANIEVVSTHVGSTGLADPGGLVIVTYTPV